MTINLNLPRPHCPNTSDHQRILTLKEKSPQNKSFLFSVVYPINNLFSWTDETMLYTSHLNFKTRCPFKDQIIIPSNDLSLILYHVQNYVKIDAEWVPYLLVVVLLLN